MLDGIRHICRDMKPRAPGSEGERDAAAYLAGVLENECGCKEIKTEAFTEHPSSFYGYFRITMVLGLLCAAAWFFAHWLSLLTGCITLLLFLLHFVMYKQILDPFFPAKESVNVTAVRPCRGEIRQRVFFNGHLDAAWEFPLNYYFGGVVFEIPGIMAVIGLFYYIVISVCSLAGAGGWVLTAGMCGLLFVPFFILVGFTYNPKRIVDGANDNLSGCYIGIALLREMERLGINTEHTELGVILTGSEEAGLRGAKAWCEAHRNDYHDVPTFIVCYDTLHDTHRLLVNRKDLNGTVSSDPELCDLLIQSAAEAGVAFKSGLVPLFGGSTDSAAFTQGGFRSAAVTGLNHKLEKYYHTRLDTFENLNADCLEQCYAAAVSLIGKLDAQQYQPGQKPNLY